jgi:mannose-6-phosphate isomerase-like protein (cupin superfamily)
MQPSQPSPATPPGAYPHEPVLVRGADTETLGHSTGAAQLLVDADRTAGALSTHRVVLEKGSDGAPPHFHARSSEQFYVLDGSLVMLNGDRIVEARKGDLIVVPAGMHHAFAAGPDDGVEVLISITPGVERFGYFRLLARVVAGEAPYQELLAREADFDSHSVASEAWQRLRGGQG